MILISTFLLNWSSYFSENGIAIPIINKKEGKTQSAVERPFQSISFNGQMAQLSSPYILTKSIAIIVNPLKISKH